MNLRYLRLHCGITQEILSERAGLAYRHYQDIESGRRPGLQLATVDRLAAALGESTHHLLEANRYAKPAVKRARCSQKITR